VQLITTLFRLSKGPLHRERRPQCLRSTNSDLLLHLSLLQGEQLLINELEIQFLRKSIGTWCMTTSLWASNTKSLTQGRLIFKTRWRSKGRCSSKLTSSSSWIKNQWRNCRLRKTTSSRTSYRKKTTSVNWRETCWNRIKVGIKMKCHRRRLLWKKCINAFKTCRMKTKFWLGHL